MNRLDTRRIVLGGTPVDLYERDEALQIIAQRASRPDGPPLGVLSANVDHITHFGTGARWAHVLDGHGRPQESDPALDAAGAEPEPTVLVADPADPSGWASGSLTLAVEGDAPLDWLHLIDGSPLATHARRLTGKAWPRLAGSDLIEPILDHADRLGLRVGILGGSVAAQEHLRERLELERPTLRIAGMWSPDREQLTQHAFNVELAAAIAAAEVELLIVGFGKPRQELWINEYGPTTGARVLLAFGAAVDFLGGSIRRAPEWVATHGLEWCWRLALEPKRLARRYLVEGPVAYGRLRVHSEVDPVRPAPVHGPAHHVIRPARAGTFVTGDEQAEVSVVIVSYNNALTIDRLIASLRVEAADVPLRVIVVDNDSTDATVGHLQQHPDVTSVASGGNRGYAGGINVGRRLAGDGEALLILNPDLEVAPGSIARMLDRMDQSEAGVVVPLVRDPVGTVSRSLRWEPSRLNALGDALFGARFPDRPSWLSETDFGAESYRHAHPIEWATGAAILIDPVVAARIGDWDERFFLYSEEVDFFRRARDVGADVWFEPTAAVVHDGGGSGGPSALAELMAANRVRYVEKHHRGVYTAEYRLIVVFAELLRAVLPGGAGAAHRRCVLAVASERRRRGLPGPVIRTEPSLAVSGAPALAPRHPRGSVIIPAHDEERTIARALAPLAQLAADGTVEVIVVANGCTDATAAIARGFAGVRVVELDHASKSAALNAGDAAASLWPRLYLDADVVMPASSLWCVFSALSGGGLLAARAASALDDTASAALVRSYYRARRRMPSLATALWGGGGYAVSAEGRSRFAQFPATSSDDVFVHGRYTERERGVIGCAPAIVQVPRTARELDATLRRTVRGSAELATILEAGGAAAAPTTRTTLRELFLSARTPAQWYDAAVYSAFALLSRTDERSLARTPRSTTAQPVSSGLPRAS